MKKLLVVLAMLVLLPVATAGADTIYYQHTGLGLTNSVSATYSDAGVTRNYGYFAGQLILSGLDGSPAQFAAYCLDFMDYLYSPQEMTQRDLTLFPGAPGDAPPRAQPATGGTIAFLLNQYGTSAMTNVQAAALQLAIWEVVLDTNHTLASGLFSVTGTNAAGSQAVTLANAYLLNMGTATNGVWLDVVDNTTRSGGQDFAFAVPEPGSMLLLGVGLFGLAWAARRRARA